MHLTRYFVCINGFIKNCIQFQIYDLRQIWKASLNVGVPTLLSGNVRAKFSLFSRQGLIPTTLRRHYLRFPLRHPMSACRASLKTIVPGSPSFSRTLFPSHIYFFLAINSSILTRYFWFVGASNKGICDYPFWLVNTVKSTPVEIFNAVARFYIWKVLRLCTIAFLTWCFLVSLIW